MKSLFPDAFLFVLDTALKDVYDKPVSRIDYLTFIENFEKNMSRNENDFDTVMINIHNERVKWGRFKVNNKQTFKLPIILQTLMDKRILTASGYLPKHHARYYRYSEAFLNALDFSDISMIAEYMNEKVYNALKYARTNNENNPQYKLLKSDRFTIDLNKCVSFIMDGYKNGSITKQSCIINLRIIFDLYHKDIFVSERESGRVYSSFTVLKRELRKYCYIDGEPLHSYDLKSAQPYFLFNYLSKKYPDSIGIRKVYDIIVKEDIYEFCKDKCNELLNTKFESRDDCKVPMFAFILKKTNKGDSVIQKMFQKVFPDVYDIFSKDKIESFYKKGITLASYLQSLEASIFIPVCNIYSSRGCLSVHDSLYFKSELRGEIETSLHEGFRKNLLSGYKLVYSRKEK